MRSQGCRESSPKRAGADTPADLNRNYSTGVCDRDELLAEPQGNCPSAAFYQQEAQPRPDIDEPSTSRRDRTDRDGHSDRSRLRDIEPRDAKRQRTGKHKGRRSGIGAA